MNELSENKKGNKGLIVTVVILSILLVGAVGYITYDKTVLQKERQEEVAEANKNLKEANESLQEANESLKGANDKITEVEKDNKKYSSIDEHNYITSNMYGHHKGIKIYAIGYMKMVYSYNDVMYCASGEFSSLLNLLMSENPIKSDENYRVRKLKINEKDISKAMITDNFYGSGAQDYTYIIKKDGSVIRYDFEMSNETHVLKDYKVKDLEVKCGKDNGDYCTMLKYNLTLQDGTTKTVEEK